MARKNISLVGKPYLSISVRLHADDLESMRAVASVEDLPIATIVRQLIKAKIASYSNLKPKTSKKGSAKRRAD